MAFAMLAEGGVDNVRIEPLARRLRVTKGGFYWHFRDRADLLAALLEHWRDGRVAVIADHAAPGPGEDAEAVLRRLLARYLDHPNPRGAAIEMAVRDWARHDPAAAEAVAMNAALNGLTDRVQAITGDVTAAGPDDGALPWTLILAGDICYEQPMAGRLMAWLRTRVAEGVPVLLADPGRSHAPRAGVEPLARVTVPTSLDLEDRTRREAVVVRLSGADGGACSSAP